MTARIVMLAAITVLSACSTEPGWRLTPETHIVRPGETLYAIAWRYGKSTRDLARWNRLGDGSLIYPGQELQLNGPTAAQRRAASGGAPPRSGKPETNGPPTGRALPALPDEPSPAWRWPTSGTVSVRFGDQPGTGTGVLIDGKLGQDVVAAAAGKVVYAGSGVLGYGKLIIVKHNDTYLSAYGYNASLLVDENDEVRAGQSIARMGEGPAQKSRLHFEIRRNGKPVDPQRHLPRR